MPYLVGLVDREEKEWVERQGYEVQSLLKLMKGVMDIGTLVGTEWIAVWLDNDVRDHLLPREEQ